MTTATGATGIKTSTAAEVPNRIQSAFEAASEHSGTSFDYLVRTAKRESNFDPLARAPTSSAAGLFQFIESTWLSTFKEVAPSIGLTKYADQIDITATGKPRVADASMRAEILNMRFDPDIASIMAGAHTAKNADYLQSRLGRDVDGGELYIAHFLGANGAGRLIETVANKPDANAVALFPKQAQANKSIFYSSGQPKTVSEVYATLTSKHHDLGARFDYAKSQSDLPGSERQQAMIAWPGVASEAAQPSTAPAIPSRLIASPLNMTFLMTETSVADDAFQITEQGDQNENVFSQSGVTGAEAQELTHQVTQQVTGAETEVAMAVPRARPLDLGAPLNDAEPPVDAQQDAPAPLSVAAVLEPSIEAAGIDNQGINNRGRPIPSRIATSWQAAEETSGRANDAFAALFANEPEGSVDAGPNPFLISNYRSTDTGSPASRLPSRLVADYGNAAPSGGDSLSQSEGQNQIQERAAGEEAARPSSQTTAPQDRREEARRDAPRPLASHIAVNQDEVFAAADLVMSPEEIAELRNRGELSALSTQATPPEIEPAVSDTGNHIRSPSLPVPRSKPVDIDGITSPTTADAALAQRQTDGSAKPQKRSGPLDLTDLVDYAKSALPFRVTLRR